MKITAINYSSHNPYDEGYRVSRLRENLTSGSEGEGLETGQNAPRQSFTRQLFFKWIKQHLRIKAFYVASENAVKTQIWIAISAYVLVAIIKKRLRIKLSLHTILQIFSVIKSDETYIKAEKKISEYEKRGMWSHAAELADKQAEKSKDMKLKCRALDNYEKAGLDVNLLDKQARTYKLKSI